ncbi:MAG: RluA family pseudouridine synthase [Candidatus Babeliaceae bacterium]
MEILQENISPQTYEFFVDTPDQAQRIDLFLHSKLPLYSRSFFQKLIGREYIKINDKIALKPSNILKIGDKITVSFPPDEPLDPSVSHEHFKNTPVTIVFAHEHFLIVTKPAGLIVHKPTEKSTLFTLVDWLLNYCQDLKKVGSTERAGIVHRLDKDTSGLLIIARTNYAHMVFGDMFKQRSIKKTYYALVTGHPPKEGTLDFPISRDPKQPNRMTHKLSFGRAAITHYKTLEYFKDCTLVEFKPITGRTHQIRVHSTAIGHPLLGDTLYGSRSTLIARHVLHALQLSFTFEGQEYNFESPLPDDFENLLTDLRKE